MKLLSVRLRIERVFNTEEKIVLQNIEIEFQDRLKLTTKTDFLIFIFKF